MTPISRTRGMVIIAVLIAIVIAALIAMGTLATAGAGAAFSKASGRSAQLRALALSGVQGAASELAAQRDSLLDGGTPKLTAEWELYHADKVHGLIRLLPPAASPAGTDPAGAASESAGLDANASDESMLAALVGADVAARIVQQRAQRAWTDRSELHLPLTPSTGQPASTPTPPAAAAPDSPPSAAPDPTVSDAAPSGARAPVDFLSTSAFEPQLASGAPQGATPGPRVPRINIAAGIPDSGLPALKELLGDELLAKLQAALKAKPATKRSELIAAIRAGGVAPANFSRVLDSVCFDDNPYAIGLVDINRAPQEVLACIPGFTPDAAAALVHARDRLDAAKRADLAWPLLEQILTADQYQAASDWITTRSLVWSIRVQASIVVDEPKSTLASAVWDVVIDVAGPTPRIVSIRDEILDQGIQLALAASSLSDESTPTPPEARSDDDAGAFNGTPNNPRLDSGAEIRDDAQSGIGDTPGGNPGTPVEAISDSPTPSKDNRIGRWTTGARR